MNRFFLFFIYLAFSCTRYQITPCELASINKEKDLSATLENTLLFYDFASVDQVTKHILHKKYNSFKIVNPGEQYNLTDIPMDIPNKRLIFGGKNDNVTFLVFEEGGVGIQTKCLVITKYAGFIVLYSIALPPLKNAADFEIILKQNKYRIYSCDEFR
jgi:hypothetical protein